MSRGPDAATLLERALLTAATRIDAAARVETADWERWESATFVGARHRIVIAGHGDAFATWLADLPDADFMLRGHLVADIAVDSVACDGDRRVATIGALTVANS